MIHTVKHGDSVGEERKEDDRTRKLTEITKQISEEQLKEEAAKS